MIVCRVQNNFCFVSFFSNSDIFEFDVVINGFSISACFMFNAVI